MYHLHKSSRVIYLYRFTRRYRVFEAELDGLGGGWWGVIQEREDEQRSNGGGLAR